MGDHVANSVEKVIILADKYNVNRDEAIRLFAYYLGDLSNTAAFDAYEVGGMTKCGFGSGK